MAFCTECGASVPDGVKFCVECGKPAGVSRPEPVPVPAQVEYARAAPVAAPPARPAAAPQYQQFPQYPAHAEDAPPPLGGKYAVMSTGAYIGTMILFAIPVIGWLACLIMALAAKNRNRRHFARAMLVFLILGMVFAVALSFLFGGVWETVQGYLQKYIGDATGGAVTDFGGLNNLSDLFKRLGTPGQ
ncbi:MAG: zinc ribbon domain-containing protein [Candidatus Accumulibacter sp.]|jgi:hypothetical protein|nr:zinc ribbon domain-containing protein [Accumulibacter sp.]